MKVTIHGCGYVGLVTGACLSDVGNEVLCVDVDEGRLEALNRGEVPIHEPGLAVIIKRNMEAGRLRFTIDPIKAVEHGLIQFVCVGTPPLADGSADLKYVLDVARTIGRHMEEYRVVADKSTVPVGTADQVSEAIAKELRERGVSIPYDVAANPEFLKEGDAIQDFMRPDRVVIGVESERASDLLRELYRPINQFECRIPSIYYLLLGNYFNDKG